MRNNPRSFHVPRGISVQKFLSSLPPVGYRVHRIGESHTLQIFLDTQSGLLYHLDFRLCRIEGRNVWRLSRPGLPAVEQACGPGGILDPGPVAEALGEKIAGREMIPQMKVRLAEKSFRFDGPGGTPLLVTLQRHLFSGPRQDTWVRGPRLLTIRAGEPPDQEEGYLASVLRDLLGLAPEEGDCLEVGLRVLRRPLPGAPALEEHRLRAEDPAEAAARKILARQAYKMWANTEGALLDLDPEFVHDLRVATRRARFALRLFAPFLDAGSSDFRREKLGWIAGLLGAVRDLDVLLENLAAILPAVEAGEDTRRAILDRLHTARHSALQVLQAALQSRRYRILRDTLPVTGTPVTAICPAGIGTVAPAWVREALAEVLRKGRKREDRRNPEKLHRLRIAFKRLRYTCEFFSELYPEEYKEILPVLVEIQDRLGAFQDARVAVARLLELAGEPIGAEAFRTGVLLAVGALAQIQRDRGRKELRGFRQSWNQFSKEARQWMARLPAPEPKPSVEVENDDATRPD